MNKNFRQEPSKERSVQSFESLLLKETGLTIDEIPNIDPGHGVSVRINAEGLLVAYDDTWVVCREILDSGTLAPREEWFGQPEMFFKVKRSAVADDILRKAEEFAARVARDNKKRY